MKKLIILTFVLLIGLQPSLKADEGMWVPMFLKQLNIKDMKKAGFKLSAEDIYSVNKSSLKDAIIIFGGGCTGEIVSPEGLIFTNHHCGYGSIQKVSTIEHDYLTDGFWSKSKEEEIPIEGLTVKFLISMDDVTAKMYEGISDTMTEGERSTVLNENSDAIVEAATKDNHYIAFVENFFAGNEYYLITYEVFTDIRLVGTPPEAVGKFGADTDNWMWPRHTGDFSMFRIYADANNRPAAYSKDNVPYKPKHFLPISLDGVEENDFNIVFGFPGRTNAYLPAAGVSQIVNVLNPAKIEIRENALKIVDKYMKADEKIRIQYASKYAGIANYWKKWIGEDQGIHQTNAIHKKKLKENEFSKRVNEKELSQYKSLFSDFERLYKEIEQVALARDYWIEVAYRNVELLNFTFSAFQLEQAYKKGGKEAFEKARTRVLSAYKKKFKNYSAKVDQPVFESLTSLYAKKIPKDYLPENMKGVDFAKLTNEIYSNTKFTSLEGINKLLAGTPEEVIEKLNKDRAYTFAKKMHGIFLTKISPEYQKINLELNAVQKEYMKALIEVFPKDRFYPDANFTLRVNYGRVKGYEPKDAVVYLPKTYLKGVLEKYVPGDYEFDVPQKLRELYNAKDFGPYGENGKMPVNFLGTNHTTGGNSGSPVMDANGNLLGLLFDGTWEGIMSDLYYDADIVRSITVDIRYVLFIIDKYAGATNLIDEMTLVHPKKK